MPAGPPYIYAIAIGSNQPRSRVLTPRKLVQGAMLMLGQSPFHRLVFSPVVETLPVGPSRRRYANAALLLETRLSPPELLTHLNALEQAAGRRRARRWNARPLDLDIILWSGGPWSDSRLIIPHAHFREREFVLGPLAGIASGWRDPITNLAIRHLWARLKKPCGKPKPVDRAVRGL